MATAATATAVTGATATGAATAGATAAGVTAAGTTATGTAEHLEPLLVQLENAWHTTAGQALGGFLGLATGAIVGYNTFFFGAMVCDVVAQFTGCISDCVYRPDKVCACARRRSESTESPCCDFKRTLLFGLCPGMIGGAIELGLWSGSFMLKIEDLQDLLAGNFYPANFGWVYLANNALNLLINFPLAFYIHNKSLNTLRFPAASAAALGLRSIFAIETFLTSSFATWTWIVTQVLSYWAFSKIMFSDTNPRLDVKIFGCGSDDLTDDLEGTEIQQDTSQNPTSKETDTAPAKPSDTSATLPSSATPDPELEPATESIHESTAQSTNMASP